MIDWTWWLVYVGGFVTGFVVAAITGVKMRRLARTLDRLLDDDPHRYCERSIPMPCERSHHLN